VERTLGIVFPRCEHHEAGYEEPIKIEQVVKIRAGRFMSGVWHLSWEGVDRD
jgi:hypothetical protein